jgi:glycosidase
VGSYHFTVLDPPMKDWLHQWPSFTQTTYKDQSAMDPYAARKDSKLLFDGWFVPSMPDLNQNNPYVANFLIQHALWSVETFGVDGWRIDTYIYNDLPFMNRCNKALMDEYPKMTMFGETWVHGTLNQAYFAENNLNIPFKSNLPGVTDFQTNLYGIAKAVNEPFGWTEGVNKLYTTLSNDFVYKNPMRNVNFLDNHDMTRFFTQVKEDLNKQKTGLMWLLTCRGIPQLYYGTEVLMKGNTYPADGWVRLDFPGGWNGDGKNAFTGAGLTREEAEIQALTKKFANFRKKSSAIKTGKMMQYVPNNGLYVYFRYDQNQTVMCVMNTDTKERAVDFGAYDERTKGFSSGVDVLTDINLPFDAPLKIGAQSMMVMELKK